MSTVADYAQTNAARFENELFEFLRIPSISTLPDHKSDVIRAAEFTASKLKAAGLENVEVIETDGHPLVYGDWLHAEGKPTVLFYGHYDVQPVDPIELWESPPFEPTIRNGSVYARGSADDKGQFYTHIKAIEALRETHGLLPVNVKFLIEGEEEVGGEAIEAYLPANSEKLRANVALVSDTAMYAPETPTICTGLRGMVYMEWLARGASRDLHSGLYGGVAPNPLFALVEVLAKCKDADGQVLIPGFYDDVEAPSAKEKASWADLPFDETAYLRDEVGSTALTGEPEFSVFERIGARPTFEVHGMPGGFTGPGAKTVIPATASAKVSVRLVPNQDPAKIFALVNRFVADNTPKGVEIEVSEIHSAPATLVNPDHPMISTAAQALKEIWGRETVYVRSGGSIPIVGEFQRHLGIPTILMGFGLPDDGLHSPNEKFSLANFHKGILSTARFLELLSE